MAHDNEVPDEDKNPEHVVPVDVWEKIRTDAASFAERVN